MYPTTLCCFRPRDNLTVLPLFIISLHIQSKLVFPIVPRSKVIWVQTQHLRCLQSLHCVTQQSPAAVQVSLFRLEKMYLDQDCFRCHYVEVCYFSPRSTLSGYCFNSVVCMAVDHCRAISRVVWTRGLRLAGRFRRRLTSGASTWNVNQEWVSSGSRVYCSPSCAQLCCWLSSCQWSHLN